MTNRLNIGIMLILFTSAFYQSILAMYSRPLTNFSTQSFNNNFFLNSIFTHDKLIQKPYSTNNKNENGINCNSNIDTETRLKKLETDLQEMASSNKEMRKVANNLKISQAILSVRLEKLNTELNNVTLKTIKLYENCRALLLDLIEQAHVLGIDGVDIHKAIKSLSDLIKQADNLGLDTLAIRHVIQSLADLTEQASITHLGTTAIDNSIRNLEYHIARLKSILKNDL